MRWGYGDGHYNGNGCGGGVGRADCLYNGDGPDIERSDMRGCSRKFEDMFIASFVIDDFVVWRVEREMTRQ